MKEAFVYKWTNILTLNWYVGFHYGTLDDGYICGSKTVRNMITSNPQDWIRTIIAEGTSKEMNELETTILQTIDARSDIRSYNRHNNHKGCYSPGWNKGLIGLQTAWNKGIPKEESHLLGNKNSLGHTPWNKGKTITDPELREKYRQGALRRHQKQLDIT
jgi:hypothetical protein